MLQGPVGYRKATNRAARSRFIAGSLSLQVPALIGVTGRPLRAWGDNLIRYDGAPAGLSFTWRTHASLPLTVTGTSTTTAISTTPQHHGARVLRIATILFGVADGEATVRAAIYRPPIATSIKRVVFAGDSITAQGHYVDSVMGLLPVGWASLGTTGPSPGGRQYEAVGGYSWYHHRNVGAMSPGTSAAITAYCTTIGGTPDYVVWVLGLGGVPTPIYATALSGGDWQAALTTEFGHADALLASWQAAKPATKHIYALTVTGSNDQALYDPGDQWRWEQAHRSIVAQMIAKWGGREREGIFVAPMYVGIDPLGGWAGSDKIHPNAATGHVQMAEVLYAAIARAYWYRGGM